MKTVTFTLPAHWALYLINGDWLGYEPVDIEVMDRWLAAHDIFGAALSADEGPGFRHHHDANYLMVGSCECLHYIFPLKEQS